MFEERNMQTFVKGLAASSMVAMVTTFTFVPVLAAESVFTVTDESRGLTNMHPALVADQ